jgi:hypothetical protein
VPPTHAQALQALTYQEILKIGEKFEKKFEAKNERIIEENKKAMDEIIKENDEVLRFEADLRIKFHVDNVTKKLNDEWEEKFKFLMEKHRNEMNEMRKIYDESRQLFCEFTTKKSEEKTRNLLEKCANETEQNLLEKWQLSVDEDLMTKLISQVIDLQNVMQERINNYDAKERMIISKLRNEYLSKMDMQNHLMTCRHTTELFHLMNVVKQNWQEKIDNIRREYEAKIAILELQFDLLPSHQSKSIILSIWNKFYKTLTTTEFDVNKLNECERALLDKIHHIQNDLIENCDDISSRVLIIQEEVDSLGIGKHPFKSTLLDNDNDENGAQTNVEKFSNDLSVELQWEKYNPIESISDADDYDVALDDVNDDFAQDPFLSSIFHEMSHTENMESIVSKIASSIIDKIKSTSNDDDEGKVENFVSNILRIFLLANKRVDSRQSLRDEIQRESLGANFGYVRTHFLCLIYAKNCTFYFPINYRHSDLKNIDSHTNILSAIDSLELLQRNSLLNKQKSKMSGFEIDTDSITPPVRISYDDCVPSYLQSPSSAFYYNNPYSFKRMTDDEWQLLKAIEKNLSDEDYEITFNEGEDDTGKRLSTVHFVDDDEPFRKIEAVHRRTNSSTSTKRNSILKKNSSIKGKIQLQSNEKREVEEGGELSKQSNAVDCDISIYLKGCENINNEEIEKIFSTLCDVDENQSQHS